MSAQIRRSTDLVFIFLVFSFIRNNVLAQLILPTAAAACAFGPSKARPLIHQHTALTPARVNCAALCKGNAFMDFSRVDWDGPVAAHSLNATQKASYNPSPHSISTVPMRITNVEMRIRIACARMQVPPYL